MKNLIKNINLSNEELWIKSVDPMYINADELTDLFLTNNIYQKLNNQYIQDIKELNEKQKVILFMFVNNYVHMTPIINVYNKYKHLLPEDISPIITKPIFRNFYVNMAILKELKISYLNILNVGILPSFLEAFCNIKYELSINICFIPIVSTKHDINYDNPYLYENMLNKFKNIYTKINILYQLRGFYEMKISDLINNDSLQSKYNLIIFDTYKNLIDLTALGSEVEINSRILSAIGMSKYIWHQIMFAINKLSIGGDLILLFPGSKILIYEQFITILSHLFETASLINVEIDYSWRYYVFCKNFKSENINIINMEKFDQINDKIMISILSDEYKCIDVNFEKNLEKKFDDINLKIKKMNDFFNREQLIKKMYADIYYHQLYRTYTFLQSVFRQYIDAERLNNKIYSDVTTYKTKLFKKLQKQSISFLLKSKIEKKPIVPILKKIQHSEFEKIMPIIKYFELKILGYLTIDKDNIFIDQKIIMKKINLKEDMIKWIEPFKIAQEDSSSDKKLDFLNFFESKNTIIIDLNMNPFIDVYDQIVIRIKFDFIKPLYISLIYGLSLLYDKMMILYPELTYNDIYIVYSKFRNSKLQKQLNQLYDSLSEKSEDILLISIDEDFMIQFNDYLSKIFIKKLMLQIRYGFFSIDSTYINLFHYMIKQSNSINKITNRWLEKNLL